MLVHLSVQWGTVERSVLTDALILAKDGHKVWIYTQKDSPLHIEAKKHNLEVMIHSGPWFPRGFTLFAPKGLGQILKSESFKAIHIYQWDLLWPISHALRNRNGISLFVSLFEEFKQNYSGFWYRPYVHRVDRYFLWGFIDQDVIAADVGVHSRRMAHLGLPPGIHDEGSSPVIARVLAEESAKNTLVAFEVAPHIEEIDDVANLLEAFAQVRIEKDLKLVLYRRYPWRESIIWPELEKKLHELKIFDRTLIVDGDAHNDLANYVDLWLSTPSCEFSTFQYLLKGVPFCAPRTAFYSELIERTGAGETYKSSDVRELRQKIERLCTKEMDFLPLAPEFYQQHGPDNYAKALINSYDHSMKYRRRIAKKVDSSLDT